MAFASDSQSTAQTDKQLVAAPGAGKRIVVQSIFVSTDTAQTVSLESGTSTLKWRQFAAANGGHTHAGKPSFECDENAALTYTSSAAGNIFVAVHYEIDD